MFEEYRAPSDDQSVRELKKAALELTAGTLSGLQGHLQLHSQRTGAKKEMLSPRQIEMAATAAVKEGVLNLKRQRLKYRSIPESRIFAIMKKMGIDPKTATFVQLQEALRGYRSEVPGIEHVGVTGPRSTAIRKTQREHLIHENAKKRTQNQVNLEIVRSAWNDCKNSILGPGVWRGYRDEFAKLRLEGQNLSSSGNPKGAVWTAGDFVIGFRVVGGHSRVAAHFEELATRAGTDLKCPAVMSPSSFWHACVFLYMKEMGRKDIFEGSDETEGGCTVPLESSEELCSWLATNEQRLLTKASESRDAGRRKKRGRPKKFTDEQKDEAARTNGETCTPF